MPSFQVNSKWASMSEVVPGLFISGVSALNRENLARHEISCVINATSEVPNLIVPGVERIKLWLEDTEDADILCHLDTITNHIEMARQTGGQVLVHCVAGVSRSASICLAYLLKYRCKTLREAYHLLSSRRQMVRPNLGFWRQLIAFEMQVKNGRSSVRLVNTGEPTQSSDDDLSGSTSTTSTSPSRVQILPDVYFPIIVPQRLSPDGEPEAQNKENQSPMIIEGRERHGSGKARFVPSLESLPELEP